MREVEREPRERPRRPQRCRASCPACADPRFRRARTPEVVVEEPDRAEPDDQREQRPTRGRERDASCGERARRRIRPRSRRPSRCRPSSACPPWRRAGARSGRRRGSAGRCRCRRSRRMRNGVLTKVTRNAVVAAIEHRDHDAAPHELLRRRPRARPPGSPSPARASPAPTSARTMRSASAASARGVDLGHGPSAAAGDHPAAGADADQHVDARARRRGGRRAACASSLCTPSSRMSPSTAIRRPVVGTLAPARRAPRSSKWDSRCTHRSAR